MTNYEQHGGEKLIEYIEDGVLPPGQVEQILSNELTVVAPDGELLSATRGEDVRAEEMDEAIKHLEAAAQARGVSVEEYIRRGIQELFHNGGLVVLNKKS